MALFQSKKILSLIIFIIVLVGIIWIFQDHFTKISFFKKSTNTLMISANQDMDMSYLEKIENFEIHEYSDNGEILYTINAETYFSFINSPIKLLKVRLKTFDDQHKEAVELTSKNAEILKTKEIIFSGMVNIETKNNVYHELESDSLTFHSDEGEITSNTNVLYQSERAIIKAKGMLMNIDSDLLLLNDSVNIKHESGSNIDTANLSINHSNGLKIYSSEDKTLYRSNETEITANSGLIMDMNKNLTNLLGKVEIIEKTGTKIKTANLLIDNSNGSEVYKTDQPTEYISVQSNIKSNEMFFDAISKKLKLTGEVVAIYE